MEDVYCKGALVETIKCSEQVELPVFVKGSGYLSMRFCKRCSDCALKHPVELEDAEGWQFISVPEQKPSSVASEQKEVQFEKR